MSLAEALAYLDSRRRKMCDILGNNSKCQWSGKDVEAIGIVLRHVRAEMTR